MRAGKFCTVDWQIQFLHRVRIFSYVAKLKYKIIDRVEYSPPQKMMKMLLLRQVYDVLVSQQVRCPSTFQQDKAYV